MELVVLGLYLRKPALDTPEFGVGRRLKVVVMVITAGTLGGVESGVACEGGGVTTRGVEGTVVELLGAPDDADGSDGPGGVCELRVADGELLGEHDHRLSVEELIDADILALEEH